MKFKTLNGSDMFNKLTELQKKINSVRNIAMDEVEKLGAIKYASRHHVLAGGIAAIQFDEKPEGWKSVGKPYQELYYPKVKNKKTLETIEKLPVVEYSELNSIVNFKGPQTISDNGSMFWVNTVAIMFGKEEVIIDVPNGAKYEVPNDMIEILESEYIKLEEKITAESE